MIKDLTGLLDKKFNELIVDEKINLEAMQRGGDEIVFSEPISINGRLYRIEDDVIFFSGNLSSVIKAPCSRCLEPVVEEVSYSFDEVVFAEGKEEDYDLIMENADEKLDLERFALCLLELRLPFSFLCDEECKGLCPICGTNLNTSQCNCNEEKIDERFAILKNLL